MSENTFFPKGKIIIKQGRGGISTSTVIKSKAQGIL
jgi:hypothetical protein